MKDIYEGIIYFTEDDYKKAYKLIKSGMNEAEKLRIILETREDDICRRVVDCADMACNLEIEEIPVCFIDEIALNFELSEYDNSLTEAEDYFIRIENYEMCARIINIRERITDLYPEYNRD